MAEWKECEAKRTCKETARRMGVVELSVVLSISFFQIIWASYLLLDWSARDRFHNCLKSSNNSNSSHSEILVEVKQVGLLLFHREVESVGFSVYIECRSSALSFWKVNSGIEKLILKIWQGGHGEATEVAKYL